MMENIFNGLEILQQQAYFISSPNKLFVSSSKPAFQENCIKNSFLLQPNVYETKHIIFAGSQ